MTSKQATAALCLECGLCCNGVLFKDVEVDTNDDVATLRRLGLAVKATSRAKNPAHKFPQPCGALCGNLRCRIYAQRPIRCQEFECALLKKVTDGNTSVEVALRKIHRAQARIRTVQRLLAKLGDDNSKLPLKKRFQTVQRRLEKGGCTAAEACDYARLSELYHALGMRLAADFYL